MALTALPMGRIQGGTCERMLEGYLVSWTSETRRSQRRFEKLEGSQRRYTGSQLMAGDICMVRFEVLLPSDLYKHVANERFEAHDLLAAT